MMKNRRIRAIDPDHVVIMEATWNASDLPDPKVYGWENVMYQYHTYLYDDYDNSKGQQIANIRNRINNTLGAGYNVPSLLGEFALFNSPDAWNFNLNLEKADLDEIENVWTKISEATNNTGLAKILSKYYRQVFTEVTR